MRARNVGTVCAVGALGALIVSGVTIAHPSAATAAPVTAADSARQAPITLTTSTTYVKGESFWIQGTAAPFSVFTASIDGVDTDYTVRTNLHGIWSFPSDTGPVAKDSFTLGLRSDDASASFTFTADTTPIALTSPSTYVKGQPARIEGTGPRNTTLRLTVGGLSTTGPRTDADGRWTWDLTAAQLRGDSFTMTLAGGGMTETITLTAGPTQPTPIGLTSPDTYTRGEPFTVTGTAAPNAALTVTPDGSTSGTPTAVDADGRWRYDVPQDLTDRDSFSLRVASSTTTATFTFTAGSTGEPTPIAVTSPSTYVTGRAFTVTGTGGKRVQYQVTLNGERWPRPITTEADGTWRFDVSTYDARQDSVVLELAGDGVSETFRFSGVDAPVELTSSTTYTPGRALTVTGTGPAGGVYDVVIDGVPTGETIRVSGGSWTYWVHPSATQGDRFTLTLRAGEQSKSFVFTAL